MMAEEETTMNKKLIALALAAAFVASSGLAYAFTCKVKAIDNDIVTLDCKKKDAKKLSPGKKIKVKKKIEGC